MSPGVPDRWLALTVRVRPAGLEGLVAEALVAVGASAVEETDGSLVTHFPPPDDPETRVEQIRRRLETLPGVGDLDLSWGWRPHEDWAEIWKRGLGPRRVAEGIVVAPTWTEPELEDGERVIRIDPGVAFGTAEHATTRGCLRLLAEVVAAGDRILDVGTGTGILAIAAALLGARRIDALDADPFACRAARENVEANGQADRIRVEEVRAGADDLVRRGPVEGIAANIQTRILLRLLPGAAHALAHGGWLVLGGIPVEERSRVTEAASGSGFHLDGEVADEGWWSGRFRKSEGPTGGEPGTR